MRFRKSFALLLVALTATSCGSTEPSTSGPVTLHARNLLLDPGSDLVIGLQPGATGIEIRPAFEPQDASLQICALDSAGTRVQCRSDVAWGVRTPMKSRSVSALRFRATTSIRLDLTIEYPDAGRAVRLEMPRVAPAPSAEACRDNACNPVVALEPPGDGRITASATFTGGTAELAVLSGRVLAQSETATGLPYRVLDSDSGTDRQLQVEATLDSQAEVAVVLRQPPGSGASGLREAVVEILWP